MTTLLSPSFLGYCTAVPYLSCDAVYHDMHWGEGLARCDLALSYYWFSSWISRKTFGEVQWNPVPSCSIPLHTHAKCIILPLVASKPCQEPDELPGFHSVSVQIILRMKRPWKACRLLILWNFHELFAPQLTMFNWNCRKLGLTTKRWTTAQQKIKESINQLCILTWNL